jgi:membrane protein YdbS with pleckstrin-like domain
MRAEPQERLNKKMIRVWRTSGLIGTAFIAVLVFIAVLLIWFNAESEDMKTFTLILIGAVILTVVCLIVFVIILPPIRWARWRYEVLEDEIDIFKGIIVYKRIIIPLIRVQFTDTSQGLIMRPFGLASVNVSTAAGKQTIPGLLLDDANSLRNRVAELAKQVHEDV